MKQATALSGLILAATLNALLVSGTPLSADTTDIDEQTKVREATLSFYVALNSVFKGDLNPMSEVWSHASDVTDMSSYGGRATGWNAVYAQFQTEARSIVGGRVQPADIQIVVKGEFAYSVCVENGQVRSPEGGNTTITNRATNIFRRERGKWKMVHHHADQSGGLEQSAPVRR